MPCSRGGSHAAGRGSLARYMKVAAIVLARRESVNCKAIWRQSGPMSYLVGPDLFFSIRSDINV